MRTFHTCLVSFRIRNFQSIKIQTVDLWTLQWYATSIATLNDHSAPPPPLRSHPPIQSIKCILSFAIKLFTVHKIQLRTQFHTQWPLHIRYPIQRLYFILIIPQRIEAINILFVSNASAEPNTDESRTASVRYTYTSTRPTIDELVDHCG